MATFKTNDNVELYYEVKGEGKPRRYLKIFGEKGAEGLRFSTIHSFALSVIRNYERLYHRRAFQIVESSGSIIRELFRELFKSYPGWRRQCIDVHRFSSP